MSNPENIFLVMEMRRMGITNLRLMEAIERIPFDAFPLEGFFNEIYEGSRPYDKGRPLTRFMAVAAICNELEVGDRMKVLEIGTASGYQTSILSKICRRVYSLDSNIDTVKLVEQRLALLGIKNATLMKGEIFKGWVAQAPFERIIANEVWLEAPEFVQEQLAEDGIILFPSGFSDGQEQKVKKMRKVKGVLVEEKALPIRFIPRDNSGE